MGQRIDLHEGHLALILKCDTITCVASLVIPVESRGDDAIAKEVNGAGWRHTRERHRRSFCPICVAEMRDAGDVLIHEEGEDE